MRTLSLLVVGALLALCGTAAAPAAAQDPCANIKAGAPHRVSGRPRPPLVLGDSSALLAVAPLVHMGIEANARGCRPLADAVSIMGARARRHTLPRVVVLVEGADGGIRPALLRRALHLVGPRGRLGLVTTAVPASAAAAMRAFHTRHPTRTVLIDWAASGIPRRYGGDGLHIGYAGEAALARFIERRVRPFTPPRITIRFPADPAAAKGCGQVHPGGRPLQVLVLRERRLITCANARRLATAKHPATLRGFHYYDWRFLGRPPWKSVFVRNDGRTIVASRTPPADAGHPVIRGTNHADNIRGTNRGERIEGRGGDDRVSARGGRDTVAGGPGNDVLHGGPGDDTLRDLSGKNEYYGGAGDDVLTAREGAPGYRTARGSKFVGGAGRDRVTGSDNDDRIDLLDGEPDVVSCGGGEDTVYADDADEVGADCEHVARD